MIIKAFGFRVGMMAREFHFADGLNVITSDGTNSVGKTTLVRLLLYSLGEQIPGTQGFRFKKLETKTLVHTDDGGRLTLIRNDKTLRIIGNDEQRFCLPFDLAQVKESIYGIGAGEVSDNLLGAFYIDQDKGWTLLNRGKVVGKIHFSVEAFLRGLSGVDQKFLLRRLEENERKYKKYKFISDAAGYRSELVDAPRLDELAPDKGRDRERLVNLRLEEASLRKRLASVRRAQKDNKRFVEYIDNLGLRVSLGDGEEMRVRSEDLVGYSDGQEYLDAEAMSLRARQSWIRQQIENLEQVSGDTESMFEVESLSDAFDRQFVRLDIDVSNLEAILDGLTEERKEIRSELSALASRGSEVYKVVNALVLEFCRMLGVEEYCLSDGKGLLTTDLRSKSGTNYHLLVLAFRMAYAASVKKILGVSLPLVVDTIRGQEMSEDNIGRSIGLLEEKMSNHQVIIATISEDGMRPDKVIRIHDHLTEDSFLVDDLDAWEIGWRLPVEDGGL